MKCKVYNHLTNVKNYVQSASTLDHITFDDTLEGRLRAFILACQTEELSLRTIEYYINTVGHFLIFLEEHQVLKPANASTDQIRLFMLQLQGRAKPGTVYDYYRAIKRFFNWMVQERNLKPEANPMAPIRAPKHPKPVIKPYTQDDIGRMLTVCDDETFHGARDAAIVWVFMDTGLRVSEMVGTQLSDVDIKERNIGVTGKGAKHRVVRIGKRANLAVLHYIKVRQGLKVGGDALWVARDGKALTRWGFRELVERFCRRAEISGVRCTPHTFRHFFGTQSLRNGAELWQVQKLLGHETLSTSQIYQRTISSEDALPGHEKFSPGDRLKF